MRRLIAFITAVLLFNTVFQLTVSAENVDELLLYIGVKIEYVWQNPAQSNGEGNIEAGDVSSGSPGYIFTTKDTPELIAQALSNNHPSVTAGFIRQLPMRDLMKILTAVKSAADILTERGREDLLALAYLGGYVAPEREYTSLDPDGAVDSLVPSSNGQNIPSWANNGDIGRVGSNAAVPVLGDLRLRSVFGESYSLGTSNFGMEETVYDTPRGTNVRAILNGYVSYVGSGVVEMRSYDQRLIVRYRGVEPAIETVIGKVYSQGETIGITSGFALGVSMSVDGINRNILQIYSESASKQWFDAWDKRNPGQSVKLVLNSGDSNYHITARELDKNNPNSYTNPEMFGVDPSTLVSDTNY